MITTRVISNESDYPFVSVPDVLKPVVAGIRDLWFVVFGPETSTDIVEDYGVLLTDWSTNATHFHLDFSIAYGFQRWTLSFDVPRDPGTVINRASSGTVTGVCTAFTDKFPVAGDSGTGLDLRVEPGRLQVYPEVVDSIDIGGATVGPDIELGDGYNTQVNFSGNLLEFTAGAGLGMGRYVAETSSSSSGSPGVMTINGINPRGGDIPINVSNSLGKVLGDARIGIIRKT